MFTKWAFKEVQNLQRTQAGWDRASIVTRSYLRQLWGRQACEGGGQPPQNLTAVVSPVPEPTANKHRAVSLQLSALSPRSCIAGFGSKKCFSYSFHPAFIFTPVAPSPPPCPETWSTVEIHHSLVPPLSLAMPPPWPLLGTDSWSFDRTCLMLGEEHFLTNRRTDELWDFSSLWGVKFTRICYLRRAKARSSTSHSPFSAAPQFWDCLKFQMCFSQ